MKKAILVSIIGAFFLSLQPPKYSGAADMPASVQSCHPEPVEGLLMKAILLRNIKKEKLKDLQQSIALVNQNLK